MKEKVFLKNNPPSEPPLLDNDTSNLNKEKWQKFWDKTANPQRYYFNHLGQLPTIELEKSEQETREKLGGFWSVLLRYINIILDEESKNRELKNELVEIKMILKARDKSLKIYKNEMKDMLDLMEEIRNKSNKTESNNLIDIEKHWLKITGHKIKKTTSVYKFFYRKISFLAIGLTPTPAMPAIEKSLCFLEKKLSSFFDEKSTEKYTLNLKLFNPLIIKIKKMIDSEGSTIDNWKNEIKKLENYLMVLSDLNTFNKLSRMKYLKKIINDDSIMVDFIKKEGDFIQALSKDDILNDEYQVFLEDLKSV